MFTKPTSLVEFILEEEKKIPQATGSLTLVLTQLEYAGKIITSHIRQAGLVDILGETGDKNVFADEVKKIDIFSNELLMQTLRDSGEVAAVGSEELDEPLWFDKSRKYIVFLDPLDGSGNVDTNAPCGTIFSIYHNTGNLLQKGRDQVAAGYILYGTSVMFVYTVGQGVNGFTLDPSVGSFLLSNPQITMPDKTTLYSANESNIHLWENTARAYLEKIKEPESIKARYIGAMVADLHRILLKGGVFIHPRDSKNTHGKLRLLYEVNPFAFIFQQAAGQSLTTDGQNPLDLTPDSVHQQVPIIMGSNHALSLFKS